MNKKDTYITEEGLEFQFTVWEDSGDYDTPAYYSVEIDKITYKNTDVTDLLFNIADEYVDNIRRKIEDDE
jgi:hypothetical protein|tara:strand:+ start:178 stop:387 length:210 start_codon:yes stop_codon:yes gene_type:complete